jgi:hypothetical protein
MAVRKDLSGQWLCESYPAGRKGRRVRQLFATKGEAVAFERYIIEQVNSKPWLGGKQDRRTLAEIAKLWFDLHEKSLAAGVRTYKKLCHIINWLGNPLATDFTAKDFAHYRVKRTNGEIYFSEKWRQGANPFTVNLEQSYLSGMFSELIRIRE